MTDPSVSVIIPAYTPRWFPEALASALSQSWSALEVIVSDDSPGTAIETTTRRLAKHDDRIIYCRNTPPAGPRDNYVAALELASGKYVKYLNDDDLLHPEAVARMVAVAEDDPSVTVVTSVRTPIDEDGRPLPGTAPTHRLLLEDSRLDGKDLLRWALIRQLNVIGEPTTVLVRRDALQAGSPDPFSVDGVAIPEPIDMALFTRLLLAGDAVYLVSPLSSFRMHHGQRQAGEESMERMLASWPALVDAARSAGVLPVAPARAGALSARPLGPRPWWPSEVRTLAEQGSRAVEAADTEQAAALLDQMVAVAGTRGALWTLLGQLADVVGVDRISREAWARAVTSEEVDPGAYLHAAEAELRAGRLGAGTDLLEAAAVAAPFDPRPRSALRALSG